MFFVPYAILCLAVIPDLSIQFSLFGLSFYSQIAPLFLCYVVFRRGFSLMGRLLFLYTVLITPFSGLGFTSVFFSFFIVFGLFHKIRTEIYTESYLVQSFWVFTLLLFQSVLLAIFSNSLYGWWSFSASVLQALVNASFMAMLCLPLFMMWDYVFDRIRGADSYQDRNSGGGALYVEGKRSSNNFL